MTPIEAATAAIKRTWTFFTLSDTRGTPEYFSEEFAKTAVRAATESVDFATLIDPSIVEPERSEVIAHLNSLGLDGKAEMSMRERKAHVAADFIKRELLVGF